MGREGEGIARVASVDLQNIRKSFGKVEAVRDVSLCDRRPRVRRLRRPFGLRQVHAAPDDRRPRGDHRAASSRIGGKPMNRVPAADRGIAMVFQSYALYPHMTVAENMGFALKMIGVGKAEVEAKVAGRRNDAAARPTARPQAAPAVAAASGSASPSAAPSPDRPTSSSSTSRCRNLDADLRAQMRVEIARLHDELKTTMIYVTHDQLEAMTLAFVRLEGAGRSRAAVWD